MLIGTCSSSRRRRRTGFITPPTPPQTTFSFVNSRQSSKCAIANLVSPTHNRITREASAGGSGCREWVARDGGESIYRRMANEKQQSFHCIQELIYFPTMVIFRSGGPVFTPTLLVLVQIAITTTAQDFITKE